MIESYLLPLIVCTPIIGVFLIFLMSSKWEEIMKIFAFSFSLVTLLESIWLWLLFDESTSKFQFMVSYQWLESYNISATLGVDGISLFLILLTTLLIPLCLLVSWESVKHSVKEYLICFFNFRILTNFNLFCFRFGFILCVL